MYVCMPGRGGRVRIKDKTTLTYIKFELLNYHMYQNTNQ